MNKKIITALIVSIVIFVIIILGINIWLKRYGVESTVVTPQAQIPAPTRGQVTDMPLEEKKESGQKAEEPEREAPIKSNEPLVN